MRKLELRKDMCMAKRKYPPGISFEVSYVLGLGYLTLCCRQEEAIRV